MSKRYWSFVALGAVVIAMSVYLMTQPHILTSLKNVSVLSIVYLIILRMLFFTTNGLFLRTFAAKFEIKLKFKEWFGIPFVTVLGNYLTPFSGGMIARAAYLKYRHAFPYTQFAVLLAANYFITFWVIGVVGLVVLLYLNFIRVHWLIPLPFLLTAVAIPLLLILPVIKLPWNNRLVRWLNAALEGWLLIKTDWALLVKLIFFTLINILLNGLSFWVAYRSLDVGVSFAVVLLISLWAVFSILINITPANFGVQETIVSLSSALLEIGSGEGLAAALVVRASAVIIAFTLGPLFSYILTKNLIVDPSENNTIVQISVGEDTK